ncbi:MAG: chromosome segregation protein [Phycisphaerales bacterium]|nr:chromosome segregation protein [Phycisphaerales bacterium]
MGPTNVALVKLFEADRKLRDAKSRLDDAAHNVRIQERRVNDLTEKLRLTQEAFKQNQARHAHLELDLKSRDLHIEKLRTQQQGAKNNKEYQALLVEINTRKVDRGKVEEQTLALIEAVEKQRGEVATLTTAAEAERTKLAAMKAASGDTLTKLQAEVDAIKPERAVAEADVPDKARDIFNRLADKYEGEAMAGIDRPDRRKEEYLCTACNMDLVRDIYNKLKNRNEVVFCPNCQRILFIPEHFTAEQAIGGPVRAPKPTVKRVKTTTAKAKAATKAAAVAAGAGAAAVEKEDANVVLIEARASGELGKALAKAQGESVSRAVASDTNPVECEVHVDGKLAGIYKGISVENLERAIKYFLGDAKLTFSTLEVKAIENDPPAAAAAEVVPAAPAPTPAPAADVQPAPVADAAPAPAEPAPAAVGAAEPDASH